MHSQQESKTTPHPSISADLTKDWGGGGRVEWWWVGELGFNSCWLSPCPASGSHCDNLSMAYGSFSISSKTTIKNYQQQAFVGLADFSKDFPEKMERKSKQLQDRQRSSSFYNAVFSSPWSFIYPSRSPSRWLSPSCPSLPSLLLPTTFSFPSTANKKFLPLPHQE